MVRKTSDIALLLGSRLRGRKNTGFGTFARLWESWFGRSPWRHERSSRVHVPGWLAVAGMLAAFAGGFVVGGRFGPDLGGGAGLKAGPSAPSFVNEFDARPLSRSAFIVAAYPDLSAADAKARAAALCTYLQSKNLPKARPYEFPAKDGPLWVVAVYFRDDAEQAMTRDQLLALVPDQVPDASFGDLRKSEAEWPRHWPIR